MTLLGETERQGFLSPTNNINVTKDISLVYKVTEHARKRRKKNDTIKLFHQVLLKSRGYTNGIGGTTCVLKKKIKYFLKCVCYVP